MVAFLESSNLGPVGKGIVIATTVGGMAAVGYYLWKRRNAAEFHVVGSISNIYMYPVKSCRRISLQKAECTKLGVTSEGFRDREFMIVKDNGHFITARQEPTMILIRPSIHGEELWLDAPNMPTLKVKKPCAPRKSEGSSAPVEKKALDVTIFGQKMLGWNCGKEASDWLNTYFDKPEFHLVYYPYESSTRKPKDTFQNWPRFKSTDNSIYADLTSYMLLSEASVTELNSRLRNKITIHNFRPNIAMKDCGPYAEENFKYIRIGDVHFRNVKPCTRCVLTTVDPETGIKDGIEPLKTLKSYKQMTKPADRKIEGDAPVFGVHLSADILGVIRVGDPIYATR